MIMKKVLLTALMLTTFTSATAFANSAGQSTTKDDALQNAIKNDVESFVKTAYVPYYTINSTKLTVRNYTLQNNVLTAQVDISLTKTFKAKTVDDVPYVKGLKKKLSDLKIAKAANVTDAEQVVNNKSKEIVTYIGVAQEQNDSFRITANVVNDKLDLKNAKLEFLDFLDWVPATDATISKHGEDDLTDAITVNKKNVMKANTN
ncbi:hypothetical protein [Paenibacillus alginolyticus]|uniref:hypothetical protein n=1 Tax=Paenibacillus alginolyticus TaxID=59839 RepID=UPI001FE7EDA4|nr:hypothetical protein [Paenibacillus frigoriresistens]